MIVNDLEWMVEANNVRVIFYDLRKYGCVGAARYLVLLDIRLNRDKAFETLKHEMMHIILGHLDHRSHLTYEEQEAEVENIRLWD